MVTISWTPPAADALPSVPGELVSGLKEIRVLRSEVGKRYHTLAINGVLPPTATMYQETSYNNGDFIVMTIDNAGNASVIRRIVRPIPDSTPPLPVQSLQIAVTATAPPTTFARVSVVDPDPTGADFTIVDNDPAFSTLIEYLDDEVSPTWTTVTTLSAGVTSGRLTKTWVQGTHSFVCLRATQNGTTTPQSCNSLVQVFPSTPVVLQNITVTPATITGGNGATGTVTLSQAAPSGGAVVLLSSNTPGVLQVPATVTVPQGNTSANFAVTTTAPQSDTPVTVRAEYGASVLLFSSIIVTGVVPPGPTGSWDHEPAGMTAVVDHDFSTVEGGGLTLYTGGGTLVTDETGEIVSPNTALRETRFVSNGMGGAWLGCGFSYSREVFTGITYKIGLNYEGTFISSDKILIISNRQEPGQSGGNWYLSLSGSPGSSSFGLAVGISTTDNIVNSHNNGPTAGGDSGPGAYTWWQNVGGGTIPKNQWCKIEFYLKLANGLDTRDGVIQVWLNEVLVTSYSNINTGTARWDEFNYTHAWGGIDSAQTQNWDIYVGHLYLSRKA